MVDDQGLRRVLVFSEPGGHYLGRILAGLNTTKASFRNLPSHWKSNNPMENEDILCIMNMLFEPILTKYVGSEHNPTANLL